MREEIERTRMDDNIPIEEIIPFGDAQFYQLTGRMGYLNKKFIPEILRNKKSIQLDEEAFKRLMPIMESVSNITYR